MVHHMVCIMLFPFLKQFMGATDLPVQCQGAGVDWYLTFGMLIKRLSMSKSFLEFRAFLGTSFLPTLCHSWGHFFGVVLNCLQHQNCKWVLSIIPRLNLLADTGWGRCWADTKILKRFTWDTGVTSGSDWVVSFSGKNDRGVTKPRYVPNVDNAYAIVAKGKEMWNKAIVCTLPT